MRRDPLSLAIPALGGSILTLLLGGPAPSEDTEHWVRFSNARFGTIAEIPAGLLKSQRPPENGDGRSFRSGDGAEIKIYGSHNLEDTFAASKAQTLKYAAEDGIDITYKAGGSTWLAFSGFKGSNVIYHKQVEGCGAIHSVYATYPRALKAKYDPVVARVAGALRCEKAWDCNKDRSRCRSLVPEYDDGRWKAQEM